MPRVWKQEAMLPGTQYDATGRKFTIRPEDVAAAHQNTQLFISRGINCPLLFEHHDVEADDPDGLRARYAKYTFGSVVGSRLAKNGAMDVEFDIPDPVDVQRFMKIKYTSPKIYRSWFDSRGNTYKGLVPVHWAASPTVVQFWQKPFQLSMTASAGPILMSLRPNPRGTTMAANSELSDLIAALRDAGINVPQEAEAMGLKGVIIAVKASSGVGGPADDDSDDLDLGDAEGSDLDLRQPAMQLSATRRQAPRRTSTIALASGTRRLTSREQAGVDLVLGRIPGHK